jgi:predicted thioredoxin/glutaredoxin
MEEEDKIEVKIKVSKNLLERYSIFYSIEKIGSIEEVLAIALEQYIDEIMLSYD